MNKRDFLKTAAIGSAALPLSAYSGQANAAGPALLTVTGAISRSNRGPFDPALDQMMSKQKIGFDKAYAFDFAALDTLPKTHIHPTLEYDAKPHKLSGPSLMEVLRIVGAPAGDAVKVLLRAIDGYAVVQSAADLRRYGMIVATRLDDKPIPLGGLGPLWAVYDADRIPEMKAKPLNERFGICPWGLYHIAIQQG